MCFPVEHAKLLKTPILKNICEWVLTIWCSQFVSGFKMKTITPNRGMIVLIKTCPGIAPYDFITCNSENTLSVWKLHIHTQEKQISLQTIQDVQLDDRPDHIALLSDAIAIAVQNKLLFYRLFKTKTSFSWKIFQCSKDEGHNSTITCVSDLQPILHATVMKHVKIVTGLKVILQDVIKETSWMLVNQ